MQVISLGIKALTGVMLIIICTMIPSAIILPQKDLTLDVLQLQSTWQIHGLFIASLLFGPEIGTVSAISYLIIGLFYLPVFHGGGSVGYILTPEFGYLLGFIPSSITCGILAKRDSQPNLIKYSIYTVISLCVLHMTGITYLTIGKIFGNWINSLFDLIIINTVIPFPSQLLLCLTISLISLLLKRILLIR